MNKNPWNNKIKSNILRQCDFENDKYLMKLLKDAESGLCAECMWESGIIIIIQCWRLSY